MSNSILYHTFGVTSVQHISTDFLVAKPFSMALSTAIISSVRTVNLAVSFGLAKLHALSKHCLLVIGKLSLLLKSPDFNAKNVVL